MYVDRLEKIRTDRSGLLTGFDEAYLLEGRGLMVSRTPNLEVGWALPQRRQRQQLSPAVRQFLTERYDEGEQQGGRKADPIQLEKKCVE